MMRLLFISILFYPFYLDCSVVSTIKSFVSGRVAIGQPAEVEVQNPLVGAEVAVAYVPPVILPESRADAILRRDLRRIRAGRLKSSEGSLMQDVIFIVKGDIPSEANAVKIKGKEREKLVFDALRIVCEKEVVPGNITVVRNPLIYGHHLRRFSRLLH